MRFISFNFHTFMNIMHAFSSMRLHRFYSFPFRHYLEVIASTHRMPEYYEGDRLLPVFARFSSNKKRLLSVEDTVKCILHPDLNEMYLCSKVPIMVNHNTIFLVDSNQLKHPKDISCDDLGVWRNNRVDTTVIQVTVTTRCVATITKHSREANVSGNTIYTLKRIYRTHGTDKSFRKITSFLLGECKVNSESSFARITSLFCFLMLCL